MRSVKRRGDGQKPFALESALSLLKLRVKNFSTKGWGGGLVDKGHAEYPSMRTGIQISGTPI